jgi:Tol biopolymer transport system component
MKRILFPTLLVLLLTACGTATSTPFTETSTATPTAEQAPPPTSIIAPTLAPNPTATPNTRLPPEQWQEWPVVPSVTGKAIEIYKAGLALGNNPRAFSKVGDCQNIKAAFMGFFDIPDRYNLGTDYQYLQETIDNFSGYFNTDGQAVKGGFNAATVLSPLWANPEICQPGENPLECELRVTKPSIVFISFEVWWDGRTPETYEKYMRQVIETVIAHGAVPILATKADNVEGDQSINLTTARLAYEYDLPLWNFWLAVQSLPNHGMDAVRNDGFHISTDGWNVRSFTGLQALDSIWRGVLDAASTSVILSTATPETTRTSNLLPVPAGGPSLEFSTDRIVFGLMSRHDGEYESQGVYLFDPTTLTVAQLLGSGFNFQSASPDGKYLLVNQGSSLYRTDGSTLTLLTDRFYDSGTTGALWLPDGRIAMVLAQGEATSLALMQSDGSGLMPVSADTAPVEIYPSTDGTRLTWERGTCNSVGQCTLAGAWLTDMSSGQSQSLNGLSRPLVSPDGQVMAYAYLPEENKSNLAFAYLSGALPRKYPLAGDILADMAWQPGGGWLGVNMDERSDYSGRVTGGNNYLINAQDFTTRQLQSVTLLNPKIVWSPDGTTLLWLGTDWQDTSYSISLWEVNVASGREVDLSEALGLKGKDYLFVSNSAWLARP